MKIKQIKISSFFLPPDFFSASKIIKQRIGCYLFFVNFLFFISLIDFKPWDLFYLISEHHGDISDILSSLTFPTVILGGPFLFFTLMNRMAIKTILKMQTKDFVGMNIMLLTVFFALFCFFYLILISSTHFCGC
jgi:hypothetical protein